jgi:hypothetical protein
MRKISIKNNHYEKWEKTKRRRKRIRAPKEKRNYKLNTRV